MFQDFEPIELPPTPKLDLFMAAMLVMAVLCFLAGAFCGTASAQDAFDLSGAEIVNAPDVRGWPARATITAVSFDGATTRIEFSKKDGPDRWPDITPAGWTGPLQYTMWLCLQNGGQWACSAFVQMWHGRDGSGTPADPDVPSVYDKHWYYDRRWAPLNGHGPIQPSEPIGLMVTSGNARDNVGPMSVQERSNVVVIPATDRGSFTFGAVLPPPPTVTPPPVVVLPPPPAPPPVVVPPVPVLDLSGVYAQLAALKQDVDAGRAENQAFYEHVGVQWKSVMAFLGKYVAPAIAGVIGGWQLGK